MALAYVVAGVLTRLFILLDGRGDHLTPKAFERQWVLSVQTQLRYFMQRDGAALGLVLRIFLRVIAQSLQDPCASAARVDRATLHIGAGFEPPRISPTCGPLFS